MNRFIAATVMTGSTTGEQLFSVRLIDRRTGEVPSINGIPLRVLTHSPQSAIAELMDGRDRHLWQAEVEPLTPDSAHMADIPGLRSGRSDIPSGARSRIETPVSRSS
ncbi:MAG TPA: hypothetical protein VNQ78_18060 [Paracoccus sp. (in: a-proteobacteria)]|uniref:hypothetical protein n=1 Tax=Paracoccus sp. TaxID=267 RepID=UPI002CD8B855|nr:hypothetical protein [Paracoccus sp. (in: a-proteobacteria)]HWL58566.1 hypothetical protein [Paracoccus sp. (in: a-proteobacteria)]